MNLYYFLCCFLALLSCSDRSSDKGVDETQSSKLEFSLELKNPKVDNGFLEFKTPHKGKGDVEHVEIIVDQKVLAVKKDLGGNNTLPIEAISDGKHEIKVTAFLVNNETLSQSASFEVNKSSVKIEEIHFPENAAAGESLSIRLKTSGNTASVYADLSQIDELAKKEPFTKEGDEYVLNHYIYRSNGFTAGHKEFAVFAEDDQGRTYKQIFEVNVTSQPLIRIASAKATVETEPLPTTGEDESFSATLVADTNSVLLTGTPNELKFELSPNLESGAQLLIGIEGFSGYLVYDIETLKQKIANGSSIRFYADAPPANTAVSVPVEIPQDALAESEKGTWNVKAVVKKPNGDLSKAKEARIRYASAKAGNLRVTLSWDSNTDVDLHVRSVDGTKIYYGNRNGKDSGELDLDSNAGCNLDFVNRENIFWTKPPSGEYSVNVHFYDDCARGEAAQAKGAKWKIKVEGCGVKLEKEGEFAPGSDSNGSAGDGVLALKFKAECLPYRVAGRAEYETLSPMGSIYSDGMSNSVVKVVADSNGQVLGEGKTGFSRFEILYKEPPQDSKVHLEFKLENEFAKVTKYNSTEVHVVKPQDSWDPKEKADYQGNFLVKVADGAGAYNIFKLINEGAAWAIGKGFKINQTHVEWERDKSNGGDSSFYVPQKDTISIQGNVEDPDEFDNLVVLHEFGHRIVQKFAVDDSWGGKHSSSTRTTPKRAWSEGFASYLAHRMANKRSYSDRAKTLGTIYYVDDLEGVPTGTDASENWSFGDISEGVVRAALWDFEDGIEPKENDNVTGKESALFAIIFGKLKKRELFEFGEKGKMDFADLIHEWGCKLPEDEKKPVQELFEKRFKLPWLTEIDFCDKT